jgi:EpsI family protein
MTALQPQHRPAPPRWWAPLIWAVLLAALGAAFAGNFAEMWMRWYPAWDRDYGLYDRLVRGESYYTHGPLIPLVSLLIFVLLVRHVRLPVRPSRTLGGVVLAASLLLHLVACLARVNFASGFAFIGVLVGGVLLLWGAAALRRLWFPLALLVFMVPLPEVTISRANFELKMRAAGGGVWLANLVGVPAARSGNRVFLPGDKSLIIANVCNGLRTLISLLAFGAIYAYVCRLRGLWRIGLFALVIPVAVVSNAVRIVSLIVVAHVWSVQIATGWYHDASGVLIFVLAFLLMFGLERSILWLRRAVGRPARVRPLFAGQLRGREDAGQWGRMAAAAGSPRGTAAAAAVVLAAAGAWWMAQTAPLTLTQEKIRDAVPASLRVGGQTFVSTREMILDQQTLTVLENPSYIYRRYRADGGRRIDFCLIFSKDNRKGTHPPDLCLEGGGEAITWAADVAVAGAGRRSPVPCRELIVQTPRSKEYFLYTYKCGRRYTRSFWVQQFTVFVNGLLRRNASGALIRVSAPARKDAGGAREACAQMLRAAIPYLDRNLP